MRNKYCLDEKKWKRAQAELLLAKELGFIEDAGIDALEKRREQKNKDNKQKEEAGECYYGPYEYSFPAYLQYELTRFKLDFIQPSEHIRKLGVCPDFPREQKKKFYEQNQELFKRYQGDLFSFEEVEQIIEKRLREEAYDERIQNILCRFDERQ